MNISRREFLAGTAALGVAGAVREELVFSHGGRVQEEDGRDGGVAKSLPLIVSTWPFGKVANERALEVMRRGGSALDGVEQGIWVTESDAANRSVGLSGHPNAAGVTQLDACIMNGPGHQAGSVAGLEGIVHPISAARRVMEKIRHVMLVGEGARWFALDQGLEAVPVEDHEGKKRAWLGKTAEERMKGQAPSGHDTIALCILNTDGTIAGGCSTSGMGGKLPGRVGDSPILGGGLYLDNEVGAAGATGIGENVMRFCASFMAVEFMRMGLAPEHACRAIIHRMAATDPAGYDLHVSFVALDKKGRYGAASTTKFNYSVTTSDASRVLKCGAIERRPKAAR